MSRSRPLLKKIVISGVILLLAVAACIWYIYTDKFSDTSERKAAYTVNAMDLLSEVKQNEGLANKKYAEKIVEVTGIVSEVEPVDTAVNIKFTDTTTGAYIIFAFQEQHIAEAKQLKEGDFVSIKGSYSAGTYSNILETEYITFKRCALSR
jgi:hypothetical protein